MSATHGSVPSIDSDRPLKILYVAACYIPHLGGTEIHTAEVARRMVDMGHDVTVVAADGPVEHEPEYHGVKVVRVSGYPRRSDFHLAPGLLRTIRQWDGDLVHVQGYHTFVAPIALTAALSSGKPTILTFHSGGHSSRLRRAIRPLQRQLLRPLLMRAAALISVSDFEKTFFSRALRIPRDRFRMMPNGTELVPLDFAAEDTGEAGERPVIASIGRLERYKGHHLVIASLPELRKSVPNVLLQIIGRGPFEGELRDQAKRLGVEDHVEFVSFSTEDRSGLARAMLRAGVVVLLSEYESQGMAVIEAASLGRPVLVASTTALTSLADSNQVHSIAIDAEPETIAKKLDSMLGQEIVPHAPKQATMSWDEIADQLLAIYRTVLSDSPDAAAD